jgi:hypothetical protein
METVLTTAQKRVLDEWVDLKGYLNSPCPVCKSSDGYTTGDLIAPPLVDPYGKVLPGKFAEPVITFACGDCGNVLIFRAARIGLV